MEKLSPPQGLGSLPSLSTLFCWVIAGALQRLHNPEVPGGNVQGALEAALSFSVHIQLTVEGTRYWDSVSLFA